MHLSLGTHTPSPPPRGDMGHEILPLDPSAEILASYKGLILYERGKSLKDTL